jgi:hypothetical protein
MSGSIMAELRPVEGIPVSGLVQFSPSILTRCVVNPGSFREYSPGVAFR